MLKGRSSGSVLISRGHFLSIQHFLKRRGITILIRISSKVRRRYCKRSSRSDFRGNELVLFQVLDPNELEPKLGEAVLLVVLDMETGDAIEASSDYARTEYRDKMNAHIEKLRELTRGAGIDHCLLRTDRSLDDGLREYFNVRQRRI